jgi:hypothetical protein
MPIGPPDGKIGDSVLYTSLVHRQTVIPDTGLHMFRFKPANDTEEFYSTMERQQYYNETARRRGVLRRGIISLISAFVASMASIGTLIS